MRFISVEQKNLCYFESETQGCKVKVNKGLGDIPPEKKEKYLCQMATIYAILSLKNRDVNLE